MWSQHRTLARMNSVIVMTRCLGKNAPWESGRDTPPKHTPAIGNNAFLLVNDPWLGPYCLKGWRKKGGIPFRLLWKYDTCRWFFCEKKDEIHQSVNLLSIWLHFVSMRNEETNCYSRPVVVFLDFIGTRKSSEESNHLLRMVLEPKYYAFRRWLYTPIILWEHDWMPRVLGPPDIFWGTICCKLICDD